MPYTVPNVYMRPVNSAYRSWPNSPANLLAGAGVFSNDGQGVVLRPDRRIISDIGSFGVGGQNVALIYSGYADPYADTRIGYLSGDVVLDSINGNDSNPGTLASPKATFQLANINYALLNNRRIWLRGHQGQQYTPMPNSYTDWYNKNGSVGNPIVMATYPGDSPAIWTNTEAQVDVNASACNFQSSYWDFRRLNIQSRGKNRDGFFIGYNAASTNIRFIDCIGTNTPLPGITQDNAGIVYLANGNADYISFIRCNFVSNQNAGSGGNAGQSAVIAFNTRHLQVIGNRFTGTAGGFYFKHDHTAATSDLVDILFKNNIHYTPGTGVGLNCSFARFVNELIIDASGSVDEGLWFYDQSGRAGGLQNTINHCTIIGASINLGAGTPGANDRLPYDCSVFNSIICDSSTRLGRRIQAPRYSTTDLRLVTDYNLIQNDMLIMNATKTISQRQSGGYDVHSIKGTPTFVGSNPSTFSDWALATGSFGKNVASDGTDIGCDVTKLLTVS